MPTLPYAGTSLTEGDALVAASRLQYPNPFFDLSRHYFPKTVKSLFKYCRIFFYQNEFIHNVILKLAEYPITDFMYEGLKDPELKKKYKQLFEEHLNLKSFLIEVGLDYFTYGNCLISANMKFKRFLKCKICKSEFQIEKVKFRMNNFRFLADCPSCKTRSAEFAIKDRYLKNPKYFKLIRWAPENISIDYDELTGESRYFYTMNEKTKKGILMGKRDVIMRVPELFITALKERKKIELDPHNLYHFKRPTLAEEDQGWGKPLLLATLKILWYMQTLRRGNEAIVADHLIPMRSMFPSSQANLDPFTQMNLGRWKSNVEAQIRKWRSDPNYMAVFPMPIGYQSLGGDARVLMVTPELKYLEESIINGLGVPVEFIKGGSTWTSSSVSLRIVENRFLTYREEINKFLNYFVMPKIKFFLNYPVCDMKMTKFKMIDDITMKELMVQLSSMGKITDSLLHTELGIDHDEETTERRKESKEGIDFTIDQVTAQAEAESKAMAIQAKGQARAQASMEEEAARLRERLFTAELIQEMGTPDKDPSEILAKQSAMVQMMPAPEQSRYLASLQTKYPLSFIFLMYRLQGAGGGDPAQLAEHQMEMERMNVEIKIKEREHGMKMKELEAKEQETIRKSEHQAKMDKEKLKTEKERVKLEKKRGEIRSTQGNTNRK